MAPSVQQILSSQNNFLCDLHNWYGSKGAKPENSKPFHYRQVTLDKSTKDTGGEDKGNW